jgi:hypothetical protein
MVSFDAADRLVLYKYLTKLAPIFIIRTASSRECFSHGKFMMDLIYIGVVALFFVVAGLYVRACEKM